MCEFKWQWFCTCDGANANMTPILTSSSNVLPHLCAYSLTSHSHLSTVSVVCRIDSARFGCNKYCIRTRWRPLLLLSYVGVQSSPRFKSIVDFSVLHCHQCTFFAQQCQGKIQLRIVFLETLIHHRCGCDLVFSSQPSAVPQSTRDSRIPCTL